MTLIESIIDYMIDTTNVLLQKNATIHELSKKVDTYENQLSNIIEDNKTLKQSSVIKTASTNSYNNEKAAAVLNKLSKIGILNNDNTNDNITALSQNVDSYSFQLLEKVANMFTDSPICNDNSLEYAESTKHAKMIKMGGCSDSIHSAYISNITYSNTGVALPPDIVSAKQKIAEKNRERERNFLQGN